MLEILTNFALREKLFREIAYNLLSMNRKSGGNFDCILLLIRSGKINGFV